MSTKQECQELQNIKYKTMLLNNNKNTFSNIQDNISNVDELLDNEYNLNKKETWNKLDKSVKMHKINNYIESLAIKHTLSNDEKSSLKQYLSISLDKKNIHKNKDVTYIKESGILENIPTLHFNNNTRKFTLKKQQQQSTLRSLGPTRKNNRSKSANNKLEKSNKTDKTDKTNKNDKPDKIDKPNKTDKSNKIDTPDKSNKIDTPDKSNKTDKTDKSNKTDKTDKINKSEKSPKKIK
jgi:hypothetical protein